MVKDDISSIPTDENDIPQISPREMVELLWDKVGADALETAQQIEKSIEDEIQKIDKKKYRSVDTNDIFLEIQERKVKRLALEAKRTYWGTVIIAAVQHEAELNQKANAAVELEDFECPSIWGEDDKEVTFDKNWNRTGCFFIVFVIIFIIGGGIYVSLNEPEESSRPPIVYTEPAHEDRSTSRLGDTAQTKHTASGEKSLEERQKAIRDRVNAALADPTAVYNTPVRGTDLRGKPRTTLAEKNRLGSHRLGTGGNVFNDPSTGEVSQVKRYLKKKYSGMAYDPLWWSDVRYYDATHEYAVRHKYTYTASSGRSVHKDQVFVFDSDGYLTDIQEYSAQ